MEIQTIKDDCSPQKNIVFKRLQYWSHQRTAGTSVDTFITELRHKSKECEFGMSENDMLRDKLVFSITDCHLKERLLQERGLTLHRAIEICRATEQEKTPLQAMKTEHGMQQVPVDGEMKMILPDKSLHHNTSKHLGYQSVPNMDQSVKLVLAAFMPKVHLHRLQLQQPSVTDCVFSERKNVEQLLPERLHIKEEPETLSEGQEGNQLCRHQETNSAACPVKCEDEEEKPQASQLHWRQQTQINIKEEPSSCTLDKFMKRQSVGINSKGPEAARNPDHSSLVLQGPDGTETDSSHTEDRNMYDDDDGGGDDGGGDSWQKPLSVSEAETRVLAHEGEKQYRCDVCNKCFQQRSSLNCHMRVHTGERPFACDVCSKCFRQKAALKVHNRVHTGEKPYRCDFCVKCFSQKADMMIHRRIHTGEKPFKCDACRKCFSQKSSLQFHMKVHTGEKQFKCGVCSKYFKLKETLKIHMGVHTEERQFKCHVCSKCFKRKAILDVHMRVHTGEKPFSCNVCSKCFCSKTALNWHMKVHTEEKPFSCDVCSKRFKKKCALKVHKSVHTGEKPYRCDFCNKCFKQKSDMKIHSRIHTGEKPFQCDFCSKCFKRQSELNSHMKVHTGEKPYRCDVCSKRFRQTSDLTRHIRIHRKYTLFTQC
ncbi:zinc finger protein 271-like [Gouania willdenowi]|uniref:zinc finger protein 271-like n=1 Tax=Gouania willdenowi TaxID=441366 RepID=UPI0010552B25|nr:zinc finger protein 271-like [Gouania willdenowi]